MNKEEIIKKYKEKINKIYEYDDKNADNEVEHAMRDDIYTQLLTEIGYQELADLLEKVEEDIGFWYA